MFPLLSSYLVYLPLLLAIYWLDVIYVVNDSLWRMFKCLLLVVVEELFLHNDKQMQKKLLGTVFCY